MLLHYTISFKILFISHPHSQYILLTVTLRAIQFPGTKQINIYVDIYEWEKITQFNLLTLLGKIRSKFIVVQEKYKTREPKKKQYSTKQQKIQNEL